MIKGVQCYTIRDFLKDRGQFEESLRRVKAMGYDSIQGGTPQFMTCGETKALLDDIGLYSCSANASYEKMLESPEAIETAVTQAKTYGVDLIAVGTLPEPLRESEDGFKQYVEGVNKITEELKKEGCKLLYHPHALEFFSLGGGKHGMDIIFNDSDPDALFFALDTHWLACGGVNYIDWIYKAKGRMPLIHFKDYAIIGGAQAIEGVSKTFAEVGEGNLDWAGIVKACHDTGVKHAIVEQDFCKGSPFDSLQISINNMKKLNV